MNSFEESIEKIKTEIEIRVKDAPIMSVAVALVLGMVIVLFMRVLLVLGVVGAGAYFIIGFLKDADDQSEPTKEKVKNSSSEDGASAGA